MKRVLATVAAGAAIAAGGQLTAAATTQFSPDPFRVCVDQACTMEVNGTIVWGQRTASMTGKMINRLPGTFAYVAFDAFAGSTKIDSLGYTVGDWHAAVVAPYTNVPMGDPNLVGGINRIRIQICSSPTRCSVQWNETRD